MQGHKSHLESCLRFTVSIVLPMWSRIAAHRALLPFVVSLSAVLSAVSLFMFPELPAFFISSVGPVAMSAKFFANRSLSAVKIFSFLFRAPGLLFRDLCLCFSAIGVWFWLPSLIEAVLGSVSSKPSRVVTSFLEGRLFLVIFELGVVP